MHVTNGQIDINAIEMHARALRAQAFRDMLVSGRKWLAGAMTLGRARKMA